MTTRTRTTLTVALAAAVGIALGVYVLPRVFLRPAPAPKVPDATALQWMDTIRAPWTEIGGDGHTATAYAIADLADSVVAGHRLTDAAAAALGEAINELERQHGTDAAMIPWIRLGRGVLERAR